MQASRKRQASSFTRALIFEIVGLLCILGLALLIAMAWQGAASTHEAARQEIGETLKRSTSRIRTILSAAELTADSVERVARTSHVSGANMRPVMENLQAAFEQQPSLSYLGIVLAKTGEYGNLERTADGTVLLWLFPGDRLTDPTVRNWVLTRDGFLPNRAYHTDGYDPRKRPFYAAGLSAQPAGTWMRTYQWVIHAAHSEPLWGFSYVKALHDDEGKLVGVLDTDFDMPTLNRFLRALSSEFNGEIRVVELGTTPRLIGAPGANAEPLPLPDDLKPLMAHSSDAPFIDQARLNGKLQWVAAQRISLRGGISWLVVVSREAPFIEAPLRHQLYQVLTMGLTIAIGFILLSINMARRFGKPLAELANHVINIGQLELDAVPSRTLPSVGNFHETQRLGEALDRMLAERKQAEAHLRHIAMYDDLTGLPSRNLIQNNIRLAIAYARRHGTLMGVLYLDLDRFKVINDGYGHLFGNAVLKTVGTQLAGLMRASDTAARLGGDEFLILLPNLAHQTDAEIVARKIVDKLNKPIIVQGREIHLSGSVGVSLFPNDGDSVETLIDNADMAMYRAKEMGRNNWQFFTSDIGQEAQRRVDMEIKLRGAIAAGQLRLVYQPKVRTDDGKITGCEALLRWQHPELGNVSPAQFISIAEDSGLIVPIGNWVLRTACAQARTWMDSGLPFVCVAVNISVRQFLQQDMVIWVMQALQETGLPPEYLELELTETLLVQDVEKITESIKALKKIGVKLSIDDFGTGYSSLNYLKNFQVDTLKIDQSFIRNMLTQKEDEAIVQAIIDLAHNLKFKVIAEGVETEAHFNFLSQHHCDEIQGYYFSRPVEAETFAAMLREHQS